ncbi:hypothetical protein Z043_116644, partial [Scleropages formosus]
MRVLSDSDARAPWSELPDGAGESRPGTTKRANGILLCQRSSDLVYLDLRNNSLSQIEPGTLSTSSRLVFLDLSCNNLTEIRSGTFRDSRSLIKLRLGNNTFLSVVSKDAFLGLTSLRELELEWNGLSCLDVGVLSQLPSLRVVRLEGNPWVCNCRFAKLFTWLMENRQKLPS